MSNKSIDKQYDIEYLHPATSAKSSKKSWIGRSVLVVLSAFIVFLISVFYKDGSIAKYLKDFVSDFNNSGVIIKKESNYNDFNTSNQVITVIKENANEVIDDVKKDTLKEKEIVVQQVANTKAPIIIDSNFDNNSGKVAITDPAPPPPLKIDNTAKKESAENAILKKNLDKLIEELLVEKKKNMTLKNKLQENKDNSDSLAKLLAETLEDSKKKNIPNTVSNIETKKPQKVVNKAKTEEPLIIAGSIKIEERPKIVSKIKIEEKSEATDSPEIEAEELSSVIQDLKKAIGEKSPASENSNKNKNKDYLSALQDLDEKKSTLTDPTVKTSLNNTSSYNKATTKMAIAVEVTEEEKEKLNDNNTISLSMKSQIDAIMLTMQETKNKSSAKKATQNISKLSTLKSSNEESTKSTGGLESQNDDLISQLSQHTTDSQDDLVDDSIVKELQAKMNKIGTSSDVSSYETALSQESTVRSNAVRSIVVKKGESLWGIAKRAYGDGKSYKKILDANPQIMKNKKVTLFVGQVIRVPN